MIDLNALPLPQLFAELAAGDRIDRVLDAALAEDLQDAGDITTQSIINKDVRASAAVVARQDGVVAGLEAASRLLARFDDVKFTVHVEDGDAIKAGSAIATVAGELRRILMLERIVLNLLGRLSGIASLTRQYTLAVQGTQAVICDTRKTTPGLRNLEKYAVRCGGGTLHRIGLFDAALYKDNHLARIPIDNLNARLTAAIRAIRSKQDIRFVEVEVDTLNQLRVIMSIEPGLVNMILLDNMDNETMKRAVEMRRTIAPQILLECSGGVTLARVRSIAEIGIDRISVGAITHAAPWLDFGLDIVE